MSAVINHVVVAGIVAKGIGVILIIFGIGVVVGIASMAALSFRLRRGTRRWGT